MKELERLATLPPLLPTGLTTNNFTLTKGI